MIHARNRVWLQQDTAGLDKEKRKLHGYLDEMILDEKYWANNTFLDIYATAYNSAGDFPDFMTDNIKSAYVRYKSIRAANSQLESSKANSRYPKAITDSLELSIGKGFDIRSLGLLAHDSAYIDSIFFSDLKKELRAAIALKFTQNSLNKFKSARNSVLDMVSSWQKEYETLFKEYKAKMLSEV